VDVGEAVAAASSDPIKHVLILALENRSFDHMLGACQAVKPDIDGIPLVGPARANSYAGRIYKQVDGAARIVIEDPRHETPHVLAQLKIDASGTPTMAASSKTIRYPIRC
jgi:phospholipase C